jgi:hypothetical protein
MQELDVGYFAILIFESALKAGDLLARLSQLFFDEFTSRLCFLLCSLGICESTACYNGNENLTPYIWNFHTEAFLMCGLGSCDFRCFKFREVRFGLGFVSVERLLQVCRHLQHPAKPKLLGAYHLASFPLLWTISPVPEVGPVTVYGQLDNKASLVSAEKVPLTTTYLLLHSCLFAPARDGPSDQQPLQEVASCFGSALAFVASDSRLPPVMHVVARAEKL